MIFNNNYDHAIMCVVYLNHLDHLIESAIKYQPQRTFRHMYLGNEKS